MIPGKGDIKVECASFKDAGSVAAPSGVFNVTSTFKKCKSLGAPCKTEGGKKETIETNKLAGSLGYLNKAHTAAGESLTSEAEPGTGYLATFECEDRQVRVHGAVIGADPPPAGTITSTPAAITVTLQRPASRRIARALDLLLDEINANPPAMPGDTRPITYQITPHRI